MNNIKEPSFYLGVVEDRMDPLKLGRVRVRIVGLHTHYKTSLPTEDLPWAYKIQQTTSGAISGIGHAPVGVLEGSWVAIQFIDPDKQMPFVVGVVGGIPQSKQQPLESFTVINSESNVKAPAPVPKNAVLDGSGQPVLDGSGNPVTSGQTEEVLSDPRWKEKVTVRLGELESGGKYNTINSIGYIGKYQFGALALTDRGYIKRGSSNSDMASPSAWTGKNGITSREAFLANERIQEAVMSENIDANYKGLKRLSVPMDTLDDPKKAGLIAAAHLYGQGGAKKFYNGIVKTDAYGTGTDKYYREGYKAIAGTYPATNDVASSETPTPEQVSETNQTAIKDASPAEDSATSSSSGYETSSIAFLDPSVGFKDPALKYPLADQINEPDTNRLARHESIGKTIVFTKEQNRHKGIEKANGKGTWDQSPTPYNAEYPFNNVWQSESGHTTEFDDTKGRERIQTYHAKGTFTEIDHNGTQVNFIVGDNYTIMERNGYVHVVGNLNVAVDGAHNLKVNNTLDIQINGNATINCHADASVNVAGDLGLTAGGDIKIKAGGDFAVDATNIHLNSGKASGLKTISAIGGASSDPAELTVKTRGQETAINYEVLEDDPVAVEKYKENMVSQGISTKEELDAPVKKVAETKPKENTVQEVETESGVPSTKTEFTGAETLSLKFKLGDLNNGNTRKLKANNGLTPEQIFGNLKALAVNCLDPIKLKYPNMTINSGYRDFVPAGGASKSQHMTGEAVDISFPGLTRAQLYDRVLEIQQLVPYDQLLLEYANGPGWIHISFAQSGNRKQHFTMNHHSRVGPIGTFTKIA